MACFGANSNRKNITTDEFSLLAFKSLITSDLLSNNWSTSTSVCNWVGVTCDKQHGRVHSLNISNMGLKGTISPNLGNLSFLVKLDLSYNSFGGHFPKEICSLHRLKVIDFRHNKFIGEIPAPLGNLSQLQYLYLGSNNFSGFIPQSIGNLRQLKILVTEYNKMSGPIPQTISNMSSLEYVYLSGNNFSGWIPEEIGYLDKLEYLILAHNSFNGSIPSKLLNISSMKHLKLEYNNFSGTIPSNARYSLPNLEKIHFDLNNFVFNR
ncbi:unnamed protein product [Trifolium pratense]|uniref:Uncharacterized protein n=1 Tax=Trifolium pratense TaxID=57577 RepID=A0ACB0J616_TRIPR|nr:unnamed protein product [Trifolium pratense]